MAELKPYVIFFTTPRNVNAWLNTGSAQQREIDKAKQESEEMEARYGQYFDKTIEYFSEDGAFVEIQRLVNEELFSKPQWMPSVWLA